MPVPMSMLNRDEILRSDVCGCYFCRSTFPATEVADWVDQDDAGVGRTALCPRCGVDAVVGSASGLPVASAAYLAELHARSFG